MQLTRYERLVLANQYRILEALYPDQGYDEYRHVLENGYELHYDMFDMIYPDGDSMTDEECSEVIQTMGMFEALQDSFAALTDTTSIDEHLLTFLGYDGNNETKFMAYASFFCRQGGGRFLSLKKGGDGFNSHMPSRDRYQRMLAAWKALDKGRQLSKDQISQILEAARHPVRA